MMDPRGSRSRRSPAPVRGRFLLGIGVLAVISHSASGQAMRVTTEEDGIYTIREGERPVLAYNFRTVPVPEGVSGIYAVARSDYIHPLYGPAGEILTEDYAEDHPHHRGIYWAWPEVTFRGTTHDLHALQGIFARPERLIGARDGEEVAEIEAENLWKWEDKQPIVRERVRIRAFPASRGVRIVDLRFSYTALVEGVTIARRGKKAYGGLNMRFSSRNDQRIARHTGTFQVPAAPSWAELVGVPPGGKGPVGVVVLQDPANCQYPEDWVQYPALNWLQPAFPAAGTAYLLSQDRPLRLAYRLCIRSGEGLRIPLAELWAEYVAGRRLMDGIEARSFLGPAARIRTLERWIARCPPAGYADLERELLAFLGESPRTKAAKNWVARQLKIVGGPSAIPHLVAGLADPALADAAARALETLPGAAVDRALLAALRKLPEERQATVIDIVARRRIAGAVPVLAQLAAGASTPVAKSAIHALGCIGDAAAAAALLDLPPRRLSAAVADARMACAGRLMQAGQRKTVAKLVDSVLDDAPPRQRASALLVLREIDPAACRQQALIWLQGKERRLRNGALAALRELPPEQVLPPLLELLPALLAPGRRAVVAVFRDLRAVAAADAVAGLLDNPETASEAALALAEIGSARHVRALARLAVTRNPGAKEAREALYGLRAVDADPAILALCSAPDAPTRRLGTDCLEARRPAAFGDALLRLCRDPDTGVVRKALAVLGRNGTPDLAAELEEWFRASPPDRAAAGAAALVGLIKRSADATARIDGILQRAAQWPPVNRAALLENLDELPTRKGEKALIAALRSPDLGERLAALRALGTWPLRPSAELLAAVVPAVAEATDQRERVLMARAREHLVLASRSNLCEGKPVTSSHPWQGSWKPEMAVDGTIAKTSYWSCAFSPSWISVDLLEEAALTAIRVINFYDGARYYQYVVEVSRDGRTWRRVADMTGNTIPATERGTVHRFAPVRARYVRVTMLKNSANPGMHIVELQAFEKLPPESAGKTE